MKEMRFWIYRLNKDENQAFNIQEHDIFSSKTGKLVNVGKKYTIWYDKYEGGYAYDSDWTYVYDSDEFPNVPESGKWKSYEEAYKWITDNYGEVTEIDYDNDN